MENLFETLGNIINPSQPQPESKMELSVEAIALIRLFMFEPNVPGVFLLRFNYREMNYKKNYAKQLGELEKAKLVKLIDKDSKSMTYRYVGNPDMKFYEKIA